MKHLAPTLVLTDDHVAGSLELSIKMEETAEIKLVEFSTDDPQNQQTQHQEHPLTRGSCRTPSKPKKESKHVESSLAPDKEKQNKNVLQCPYMTERGFSLRRHILSKHGAEALKSAEYGECICLTCGYKCFSLKIFKAI